MAEDCIFCLISDGALPSTKVLENEEFLAFRDINPAAPVHVLVIPRRHIARLSESTPSDEAMLGRFLLFVGSVVQELGLDSYRLIINDGAGAGQTVFHLHAHILSGRELSPRLL